MAHQSEGTPRLPFPNLEDPVVPAPGTRPEYTPLKDHYKVFIRVEPTVIDGSTWKLPITGLVDNPLMLTLDDISNDYESMSHFVTLSCISGRIPSTLISTTQWTGVSLQKVLADAKVRDGARSHLHHVGRRLLRDGPPRRDSRRRADHADLCVGRQPATRLRMASRSASGGPDRYGMEAAQVDHRHRGHGRDQGRLLDRAWMGPGRPGENHLCH